MKKQEVYDVVCAHLAEQKERSIFGYKCLYRGPNKLKCAAGILITDEEYHGAMEGISLSELINSGNQIKNINKRNLRLVDGLQMAHDHYRDASSLQEKLRNVAMAHNVKAGAEQAITEWCGTSIEN